MKAQERHHLKENEFATTAARVAEQVAANRTSILMLVGAAAVVGALVAGYFYWQARTYDKASALLGAALVIDQATIAPAPTVPGAKQAAGTYPTETARGEAAVAAFQKTIDAYPTHEVGTAARYHLGTTLLSLGRGADAERAFAEAAAKGGSSLYAEMAKLGHAQALAAQKKFDEAIKALTDLSGQRDGRLPVDGVLMELARVCRQAGKTQEARAAFKRVVDEFSDSGYVTEARQQLATLG